MITTTEANKGRPLTTLPRQHHTIMQHTLLHPSQHLRRHITQAIPLLDHHIRMDKGSSKQVLHLSTLCSTTTRTR
jgi:hypothetical protein